MLDRNSSKLAAAVAGQSPPRNAQELAKVIFHQLARMIHEIQHDGLDELKCTPNMYQMRQISNFESLPIQYHVTDHQKVP